MKGKLTRLLRLREIEEEQSRLELEALVAERNRIVDAMAQIEEWQADGRRAWARAILDRSQQGRMDGMMQVEVARQQQVYLLPRLERTALAVEWQRAEFMEKRIDRMQIETLVTEEQRAAQAAIEHQAQQMLDDWYGRRRRAQQRDADRNEDQRRDKDRRRAIVETTKAGEQ